MLPQFRFFLRPHGQVIIQDDRLAIQHKIFEVGIFFKNVEEFIYQVNQPQPELLKSQVPFSVPMRM
jgi:hypothetical protein